ncbi:MAG TPA: hypothetical protein VHW26_11915, partial [Solirubrobacteraceae bacterium]|nr:hypothetical protein [Solirubrobacteraceae bacterium]
YRSAGDLELALQLSGPDARAGRTRRRPCRADAPPPVPGGRAAARERAGGSPLLVSGRTAAAGERAGWRRW